MTFMVNNNWAGSLLLLWFNLLPVFLTLLSLSRTVAEVTICVSCIVDLLRIVVWNVLYIWSELFAYYVFRYCDIYMFLIELNKLPFSIYIYIYIYIYIWSPHLGEPLSLFTYYYFYN